MTEASGKKLSHSEYLYFFAISRAKYYRFSLSSSHERLLADDPQIERVAHTVSVAGAVLPRSFWSRRPVPFLT
jgi:hypothetical protein